MAIDRKHCINQFYHNAVNQKLKELLRVLEIGGESEWGTMSHQNLIAYTILLLSVEYHAITEQPLFEILKDIAGAEFSNESSQKTEESLPL